MLPEIKRIEDFFPAIRDEAVQITCRKSRHDFSKPPPHIEHIFQKFLFFLPSINMPSEPITSCRETAREKRADVWARFQVGKTYSKIGRLTDLAK
jgi:hypothetical protein